MENKGSVKTGQFIIPPNTDLNNLRFNNTALKNVDAKNQTLMDKAVLNDPIFEKLLDHIETIDFEFEASDGQVLDYRKKLSQTEDLGQVSKLEKAIKNFMPDEDEKYVIIMEQLLKLADLLGLGLIFTNASHFVYNYAYWEESNPAMFFAFLGHVAVRSGIPKLKARQHRIGDKLLKQFITTAAFVEPKVVDNEVKINLLNGTYCISEGSEEGELRKPKKEDLLKYQLPFNYDQNATAPLFEEYLDKVLPDKKCQDVLLEYIGYVFTRDMKLEKTLFLYGSGANGKSVFFEVINALLGDVNVSNISMEDLLDDSGYYRAQINNKLLNYCSELGHIKDMQLFKKMISGEPITARSPYKEPFVMTRYCKFVFNANGLPEVEQTEAFFRRQIIVPFTHTIPKSEQDINLHKKIINLELSGVFNLVLEGLKRLIKQGTFTESEIITEQIDNYRKGSDNVHSFLDDERWRKSSFSKIALKEFYPQYKLYCGENGYRSLSRQNLTSRLRKLGYSVERGAQGYFYVWCERIPDETEISPEDQQKILSHFFKN